MKSDSILLRRKRRNLIRRVIDPDQHSIWHLVLETCMLLGWQRRETLEGLLRCGRNHFLFLFNHPSTTFLDARRFCAARPRVVQEMAGIGPAPVPVEAPDLEDQLPQANDGQVPIHMNDEAHNAGTAGVHAVAPQHEHEVQFPRGSTSFAEETPTLYPSSSYAQGTVLDVRRATSNNIQIDL
ncbi:hypothetical protein SeLEV6574_g06557 [Synchytrium endobioticum]|uniref:Uncharacterized protein n=1 Tax=Synchytrium endobioticum TaxID=286115 RepID=A0A507CN50_9FUNG|nr:hypothetical protein SeLEV6574_g06557 [Synchytrium endobioticum]